MRIATVNVNGIRAAARKGMDQWLRSSGADVVSPRGDQYQLTATGETDLRSGAMVTVTATAQDGVVVTNLRALPS